MNVSVVIPCYNSTAFLRSTVESALAQTCPPLEIICVDDASTDSTWELMAELERESGGIVRPLRHSENKGTPASGRNTAIAAAKGDWIAFLDHDDLWLPNKLEIQTDLLAENPEARLLHTACWEQFEDDESSRILTDTNRQNPEGDPFRCLYGRNFVSCLTAVVRRDVFESLGPLREEREFIGVDDYDLWLRMAFANLQFAYSPEPTAVWRRHSGNVSGDRILQIEAERRALEALGSKIASNQRIESVLSSARWRWLTLEKAYHLTAGGDAESARDTLRRLWPMSSTVPDLIKLRARLKISSANAERSVSLLDKAWKKYRKRTLDLL